jgi:uncharacterized protein
MRHDRVAVPSEKTTNMTGVWIEVTERALRVIEALKATFGDLVLYESGIRAGMGAPVCYPLAEFQQGSSDMLCGHVTTVPVFMTFAQFEQCRGARLIFDVVVSSESALFLEASCGVRFVTWVVRDEPGGVKVRH